MGRKKIQISRITDERNRQVTFNKRKFGVMKKAYELSVLCDCEIALIIFSSSNKLYQYASTDMDKVLLKYTEYNEPHESLTNKNIIEALNKKEHKNGACGSPESGDNDSEFQLTPRTEAKYNKIDEEFQMIHFQVGMNYSLPVPINSGYGDPALLTTPHTSVSPRPSSSETDPGYPNSGMLDMSNGYPNSSSPLGSPSPGQSPGLGVKTGHPPKQHSPGPSPRSSLRVVIPASQGQQSTQDQAPSLPGLSYSSSLTSFSAQDFSVGSDMSLNPLSWGHSTISHSSGLPQLAVSSNTPPPTSPLPLTIKSEPISPPRDANHGLMHPTISQGHSLGHTLHHNLPRPSSAGHLTPTSGTVTPTNLSSSGDPRHSNSDYDSGPLNKRARLPDQWAT
ncbi:UNVERIFIED_CONTAM: hypothetical protein PYX00_000072 [Menopon gallinae]|uniref:MADS-box domain-containing protein n=1 Tax=Menopon gallinae TaxID=328185 RepID=A0AAW2I922_9NEOP